MRILLLLKTALNDDKGNNGERGNALDSYFIKYWHLVFLIGIDFGDLGISQGLEKRY